MQIEFPLVLDIVGERDRMAFCLLNPNRRRSGVNSHVSSPRNFISRASDGSSRGEGTGSAAHKHLRTTEKLRQLLENTLPLRERRSFGEGTAHATVNFFRLMPKEHALVSSID
jgi:hypothetical protein